MHQQAGWQIEFRDGPLAGQVRHVDTEPDEEFEVPAEEGGPFTYARVSSEGAEDSPDPIRVIYDPEEPILSQRENRAKKLASIPVPEMKPGGRWAR